MCPHGSTLPIRSILRNGQLPQLESSAGFNLEDVQTNLIMLEPTVFLNKKFPTVSIIRPTATKGAAMGAVKNLMADGLFIGQTKEFFEFLQDLAAEADAARGGLMK